MQIPWAWKQPWLLTLKERSFFSCFLLIASLLALAWRGRQSGRPTTTVRMPTVATSDACEDRNSYATLSNATFSLRLWYQLPHPLWGRDESDEPSARAWAGRFYTSRYDLMTSWWTVSFVRFLPTCNELAVTSVYWALFFSGVASPASDWLFVGCLPQCKVVVDHQQQRLKFTRNLLRLAQAHLSLKLLRLKKSFDLACSRVVSVPLDLSMFENDIDLIHIIKYIMVEWSSR